jgi:hypothetical protein
MDRFENCIAAFEHSISRAREMIKLFDALSLIRPTAVNDDALRAAYFQAVSSFDYYVHEIVAIEANYRFANCIRTRNIHIPMEIYIINDPEERLNAVNAFVREKNSYKAFVDPSKLAEILSCFVEDPWERIASEYLIDQPEGPEKSGLKAQLKSIWSRRNKIAHEADVNPTLSGVTLWPMEKSDTEMTIVFLVSIGRTLPTVMSAELR